MQKRRRPKPTLLRPRGWDAGVYGGLGSIARRHGVGTDYRPGRNHSEYRRRSRPRVRQWQSSGSSRSRCCSVRRMSNSAAAFLRALPTCTGYVAPGSSSRNGAGRLCSSRAACFLISSNVCGSETRLPPLMTRWISPSPSCCRSLARQCRLSCGRRADSAAKPACGRARCPCRAHACGAPIRHIPPACRRSRAQAHRRRS